MLPEVDIAFSGLPVSYEASLKPTSTKGAVTAVGYVEIGCAAKLAQDALEGSHVGASQ